MATKKPTKKPTPKPAKKAVIKAKPKSKPAPAKKSPAKAKPAKPAKTAKSTAKATKVLKPAPRRALPTPVQPSWLPAGYRTITPRLVVRDTASAIEWYTKALGAEEVVRHVYGGMCVHAELKIGDSRLHLNDQMPNTPNTAPSETNAPTCGIDVYVSDVDALVARAIEHGATVVMPVSDAFWGDRCGVIKDPHGHVWMLATHVRTLTKEEIDAAALVAFAQPECSEPVQS